MLKKISYMILAIGIATCLIGAYIMAFGESILGPNHTGIATIVGITGIGLISTANTTLLATRKREEQ